MHFDLQPNVMCLRYEHPLLLERPRGWTLKNHFPAAEHPTRPHPENSGAVTPNEAALTRIGPETREPKNEPFEMSPLRR
jgi:hypothetical protein